MKITEEMIRLKAYQLWELRGRAVGSAENDWYEAQDCLRRELIASQEHSSLGKRKPAQKAKSKRYGLRTVKEA